jgi:hypothetical protein
MEMSVERKKIVTLSLTREWKVKVVNRWRINQDRPCNHAAAM